MRKTRQFRPAGVDALEERVVMSTGVMGAAWRPPIHVFPIVTPQVHTLTQRTLNQVISRVDQSFQRLASDYQRAYQMVSRAVPWMGEGGAVDLLNTYAAHRGARFANELYMAPRGIPYGVRNIGPQLEAVGQETAFYLSNMNSLAEAGRAGMNVIYPGQFQARLTLINAVRNDVASGLYRFR